jgi:hypothetical protein
VKAGLTADASGVVRLNGTIRNDKTGEESSFRLWIDKQSSNGRCNIFCVNCFLVVWQMVSAVSFLGMT